MVHVYHRIILTFSVVFPYSTTYPYSPCQKKNLLGFKCSHICLLLRDKEALSSDLSINCYSFSLKHNSAHVFVVGSSFLDKTAVVAGGHFKVIGTLNNETESTERTISLHLNCEKNILLCVHCSNFTFYIKPF